MAADIQYPVDHSFACIVDFVMEVRKKYSRPSRFSSTLNAYLKESTIHGMSYLSVGDKSRGYIFQVVFWLCALLTGYGIATYLINQSFRETYNFPIISTIDSISINNLPFPAVTINAGDTINPWGTMEKLYNLVEFECYDYPWDCPPDRKAPIKDLGILATEMADRFFESVINYLKEMTLADLKSYRKDEVAIAKSFAFPEFEKSAALLAMLVDKKSSRLPVVWRKLAVATGETFATFTVKKLGNSRGWGTKYFYPVVVEEAAKYNVTEEDAKACLSNEEDCPDTYLEAYATVLLPYIFNRVPYEGLGLGDFISYVSSRVLSVSVKKYNETYPFLNSRDSSSAEVEFADYITTVTNDLLGIQAGMTLYELAKLLDKPNDPEGTEPQAFFVGLNSNCIDDAITAVWMRAWKSYLGLWPNKHTIAAGYNDDVHEPPCTNSTLDEMLGLTDCCAMTKPLKGNNDLMLKYMKYTIQPPHFSQTIEEEKWDYDWAKKSFPKYEIRNTSFSQWDDELKLHLDIRNQNPRIYSSQYNHKPLSDADMIFSQLFVRSYTTEGFGYTFNNRLFWNKHQKENEFNQAFYKIMHPFLNDGEPDTYYPETTGPVHGLNLIVQLNKYDKDVFRDNEKTFPTVRVTLHDPNKPADLRGAGIDIRPGYDSTFLITPSQVQTSPDIERIDLARRKCKFPDEIEGLKIFNEYTQNACMFECMLSQAADKCLCVPWNYPMFNLSVQTCDYQGVYCFEEVSFGKAICLAKSDNCFLCRSCPTSQQQRTVTVPMTVIPTTTHIPSPLPRLRLRRSAGSRSTRSVASPPSPTSPS